MGEGRQPKREPIAIVGRDCLLPGADSTAAYQALLQASGDVIRPATEVDWGVDPNGLLAAAKGTPDRCSSTFGGWRSEPAPGDGELGIAMEQGRDRIHLWAERCAARALEEAGISEGEVGRQRCASLLAAYSWAPGFGSMAGLQPHYAERLARWVKEGGVGNAAVRSALSEAFDQLRDQSAGRVENICVAGRVASDLSNRLGLGGPSYAIDAACASSLYAIKLAMLHLWSGQCDSAVVTGVSASHPVFATLGFSALQALPENDRSRPLDAASEGLSPAEGCISLVLQRLGDAVRDGRRIHAVVRGVGLSNDGRGRHLLAPRTEGQTLACRRALEEAGVLPESIDYVDCHATGTAVGDLAELKTLSALFPEGQFPWIGSAKSNLGHLLTAAGLAGMLKTMLGMEAERLFANVAVREPLRLPERDEVAAKILRETRPWPVRKSDEPRRAAIDAFGFGGANSQLILDQFAAPASLPAERPAPLATSSLLVTGMAGAFGDCPDLDALRRRWHRPPGDEEFSSLPAERWDGFRLRGSPGGQAPSGPRANPIESFDLDALRCQLVPEAIEKMNPQQLLMLDVADQALRDSGCEPGGRVAVLVAHEEDLMVHRLLMRWQVEHLVDRALARADCQMKPAARVELVETLRELLHPQVGVADFPSYIGNLMASRIASLWDFSGPAFSITAQRSSVARGLEMARLFLASGEADAVLLGAVDLGAHFENVVVRQLIEAGGGEPAIPADGAGAMLLEPEGSKGERVYATIESEAVALLDAGDPRDRAVEVALEKAVCEAGSLGLIQADVAVDQFKAAESVLADAPARSVVFSNARGRFGDAGCAGPLLDLLLAASALNDRLLPTAGADADSLPEPFFCSQTSVPWTRPSAKPRCALISNDDSTGAASAIVLSDRHRRAAGQAGVAVTPVGSRQLFFAEAADVAGLATVLVGWEEALSSGREELSLEGLSSKSLERVMDTPRPSDEGLRLCLCAGSPDELRVELRSALAHLERDPETDWQTPAGSRFTPRPLGVEGQLAFVYTPFDTPYPGLQPDLGTLFPGADEAIETVLDDSELALGARLLFPRSAASPTPRERVEQESALLASTFDLMRAGTAHSIRATVALREALGLRPSEAFGYSMGEISMLLALGVWETDRDWIDRLRDSKLFDERIGGDCKTARAALGVADDAPFQWTGRVVLLPAEEVREGVRGLAGLYVSQASTLGETVICGEAEAVSKACHILGAESFRMEQPLVVHCPPAQAVMSDFTNCLPASDLLPPGIRLRFSSNPRANLRSGASETGLAGRVADGLAGYLDFPALVNASYAEGVRVFIEVGPRNSCTRRVASILGGAEHLALSVDQRGVATRDSFAALVAACLVHRVPIRSASWRAMLRPDREFGLRVRRLPGRAASPRVGGEGATAVESFESPPAPLPIPSQPSEPAANPLVEARRASRRHRDWLDSRRRALDEALGRNVRAEDDKPCLFDEAAVMEFAEGRLSRVFGPEYAAFDSLTQRMRLPSPPFLALSRVLSLEGKPFALEPCSIVTEYDVPQRYWGRTGASASFLAADAQGVLFLLGYIGIDRWLEGIRTYRWLDAKMRFVGDSLPVGSTVRYHIRIRSFTRHGDVILFVTDFDCDVDGRRFLEIRDCTAGFFTEEELEKGQGLAAETREAGDFCVLPELSRVSSLDEGRLSAWQSGSAASCFGPPFRAIGEANPDLRLVSGPMRFIDRVPLLRLPGAEEGPHLVAEKDLDPLDWYLRAHFKDAPVFAGPCMVEACFQCLQTYAVYLGLAEGLRGASFAPARDCRMEVKFRGQVPAEAGVFELRMYAVRVRAGDERTVEGDFDLVYRNRIIGRVRGLGIRIEGQPAALGTAPNRRQSNSLKP